MNSSCRASMAWIIAVLVCLSAGQLLAQKPDAQKAQNNSPAAEKDGGTAPRYSLQNAKTAAAAADASYLIGPQDVLAIEVWKEKELSTAGVPVRPDGKISLPLLNDVQAAGLTAMQLAADITDKLKKYLDNPKVTVVVVQVNSRQVYVLGEVAHPGAFPLNPHMTVLQVIAKAGGLTEYAHKKDIQLKRAGQPPQAFNYVKVIKGKSPDVDLQAGDTVIVQ